jgi:hypothetical protein
MFLHKLHKKNRRTIEDLSISPYQLKLGNLNDVVSEFISDDLLRISSFEESVGMLMTIPKLKEYLKQRGEKCTGKKNELVKRAIEKFSDEERLQVEETGRLYLITQRGWKIIEEDGNRFNQELDRFQKSLIEPLSKSDFETVFKEVSAFYSTYQFPVGLGLTGENCINGQVRDVAIQIMESNYLTGSMALERDLEQRIRAIVCLNYLFTSFGITDFDLEGNMIAVWTDFSCNEIEEFLRRTPTGIFRHNDAESKSDVIEIFYHALWIEALNNVELKKILESNFRNRYSGIEILSGTTSCNKCEGLSSFFAWGELNRLPKLPQYPGCTCAYTMKE